MWFATDGEDCTLCNPARYYEGANVKIRETIERDCCHPSKDLKPVIGCKVAPQGVAVLVFCIHCGHRHEYHRFTDPAGGTDWEYRPMPEKWENW